MKVEVVYNEFTNWEQPVNVVVKEDNHVVYCNHVDTRIAEEDMGFVDRYRGDWVSNVQKLELCRKCKSWRYLHGTWEEGNE